MELALVLEGESVVEDAAVSGSTRKECGTVAHGILDESLVDFDVGNWGMDDRVCIDFTIAAHSLTITSIVRANRRLDVLGLDHLVHVLHLLAALRCTRHILSISANHLLLDGRYSHFQFIILLVYRLLQSLKQIRERLNIPLDCITGLTYFPIALLEHAQYLTLNQRLYHLSKVLSLLVLEIIDFLLQVLN